MLTTSPSPGRDPASIREEEGLGTHWTNLRTEASIAITTALEGDDEDRYRAVTEHLEYLLDIPRDPNESDNELMVRLLANFLDQIGPLRRAGGMNAFDALFWMTDAGWDVEVALNNMQVAEERGRNPESSSDEDASEKLGEESEEAPVSRVFHYVPVLP